MKVVIIIILPRKKLQKNTVLILFNFLKRLLRTVENVEFLSKQNETFGGEESRNQTCRG